MMNEHETERQLYLLGEMKDFLPDRETDPLSSAEEEDELDISDLSLVSAAGTAQNYHHFLIMAKEACHRSI